MYRWARAARRHPRNRGATTVELSILTTVVAGSLVLGLATLGDTLGTLFTCMAEQLSGGEPSGQCTVEDSAPDGSDSGGTGTEPTGDPVGSGNDSGTDPTGTSSGEDPSPTSTTSSTPVSPTTESPTAPPT